MHDAGVLGWLTMTIVVIAVWSLVAWLLVSLARSSTHPHERPMDILERRLARGEITEEEYRRLRDALRGGHHPAGT